MARTASALHLTNGDAVLYLFRKAGILGTHVAWKDLLHEGPVPTGLGLDELRPIRAAYLASRGYGKPIKIMHDFETRDATFRRAGEFEEVVLWFEHDLYDQLQLLQILVELDAMGLEPGRVSLIQSDDYLGSMTADEISSLHAKRRNVTSPAFGHAKRAWSAFTGSDSTALLPYARETTPGFPHLRAAFERLCEEYPSVSDGLSRSERHALAAVAQGPAREEELFRRAQAREEAPFLGDTAFYAILGSLQSGEAPLVEHEDGALVPTALGRRVLAGDADWLESAPVDRWIGGAHLHGPAALRYDEDKRTFRSSGAAVDS